MKYVYPQWSFHRQPYPAELSWLCIRNIFHFYSEYCPDWCLLHQARSWKKCCSARPNRWYLSSFLPFHYSVCNVLRYPPPENHSPNHENSGTCHRPDQRKGTAVTDRSPSRLGLPHSISGVIYSDNPGKPDIPFLHPRINRSGRHPATDVHLPYCRRHKLYSAVLEPYPKQYNRP